MARRLLEVAAAVALAFLATACGDEPTSAPQDGPAFVQAPSPNACVFSGNPSLSNASNAYFVTNSDRQTASGFIGQMEDGFTASSYAGARPAGYDLLAFIGSVSRGTAPGDTADGGALVRQAIQCMFDVEDANDNDQEPFYLWPGDKQFDFGRALAFSAAGAFFVRGGAADATTPVVANDESKGTGSAGNISGIAPPTGSTWPGIVVTGLVPDRVLIYGEPVTNGYDWKLIPRSTAFTPSATVALCPAASSGTGTTADMISQETVGVLGFVNADFICEVEPEALAFAGGLGSLAMFRHLGRSLGQWLEPTPLQAAVRTSTIGGSAGGAKSDKFTERYLPEVTLSFASPGQQPPKNIKVNTRFSVKVNVTTPEGGPAGGITVTLATSTNNGTGTAIYELTSAAPATGPVNCSASSPYVTTPSETTLGVVGAGGQAQPTVAVWNNNLCFSKAGSVYTIATSKAELRTGGIGTKMSTKSNVGP